MGRLLSCLLLLCFAGVAYAYDVKIDSLVTTPANCGDDGSIVVYLGGKDAGGLRDATYEAGGKLSYQPFIPYLKPGTYTVSVTGWLDDEPVMLSGSATVGGTTSYTPLDARIVSVRDALSDKATGKVTLRLTHGKLPYTVEVLDGLALVTMERFTSAQPEYAVEGIPAGTYSIRIKDGCSTIYLMQVINKISPAFNCAKMQVYPDSHQQTGVRIELLPWGSENEYYEEHKRGDRVWWEYRLSFDGRLRTDWKDIPADGVVRDSFPSQSYCDLWGKIYMVDVRIKDDYGKIECTQYLTIDKPDISAQNYISLHESGCIKDTLITFNVSGGYYHPPLRMKVRNLTRNVTLYDKEYVGNELIRIASDMFEDVISCEFTDAKGCVFSMQRILGSTSGFGCWSSYYHSSPCDRNGIGVTFSRVDVEPDSKPFVDIPEGTVVELLEAPDTTMCFRAKWDRSTMEWTFVGRRPANISATANGIYLNDPETNVTETALPSGKYKFRVTDGCGYHAVFEEDVDFYRYKVITPLHIGGGTPTCEGVQYFPSNKVERYRYTVNGFEPGEEMKTYFRVSSPDGGEVMVYDDTMNGGSFVVNPQYNSPSQTFTVQDFYDGCLISEVKVDYRKPSPINIKSAVGYRCKGGEAIITVVPDSTTGIQPYKFELYKENSSRPIATNTTGEFRVSGTDNSFRIRLTDGCNQSDAAYTEAERYINVLNVGVDRIIMGKETLCLGEKDSLRCRLLAGTCEWTRPDGRMEQTRNIGVSCAEEGKLETGWYHLRINGLECEVVDSILVSVERSYNDTLYLAPICDSELPFIYEGVRFEEGGFKTIHDWTVNGCDSVTTYHLTVNPTYYQERKATICESDLPYTYADTVFAVGTQTGRYTFYRKTTQGCDSTVVLDLIVGQLKDTAFHEEIFQYEAFSKYNFNLPEQTEVGTFDHVQHLHTVYDCDSVVTLHLTVLPVVKAQVALNMEEVCGDETGLEVTYEVYEGEARSCSVRFSDNALSAGFVPITVTELTGKHTIPIALPDPAVPDTYTLTFTFENEYGYVDEHVVELTIVGNPAETVFEEEIFKYEDFPKYNFNLPEQTVTGTFEHVQHLQTVAGCDSVVTLHLTVLPVVKAQVDTKHVELCGDEAGFDITYSILEGEPERCVVSFADKAQQAGFVDFTDDFPDRVSVPVALPSFVRPDHYSLTFSVENSYGYADRHEVSFTALYPSSVVLQMWNDVLAVMNAEHNGGYTFSRYRWYKDGQPLGGETQSYLYVGPSAVLDTNAEYTVELTRADDGATVLSCPVVPEVQSEVSVYPTLLNTSERMTVHAEARGKVSVWTLSGVRVLEQDMEEGDNVLVSPAQPGTYMLNMSFENGVRIKQMIVVR